MTEQEEDEDICDIEDERYKLLQTIDAIQPLVLGSTSYRKYVERLKEEVKVSLKNESSNLLMIVQAIKDCKSACYKRDVLIQVLDLLCFDDEDFMRNLLCDTYCRRRTKTSGSMLWKEMANALVALPDLVANCDVLNKFERFKSDHFYSKLLECLYDTLVELKIGSRPGLNKEQRCFYLQILGRIAIGGQHTQLVWTKFTSRILHMDKNHRAFDEIKQMFSLPLSSSDDNHDDDDQVSFQFELFIEPLYFPIFYYLNPTKNSGQLIKALLDDLILTNEHFEYVICNKCILQTNFANKRHRQSVILFNVFAYLSSLNGDNDIDGEDESGRSQSNTYKRSNLLIKTLLEVAGSWSNGTKILFRPYEQNRYISCALLIGFRYALMCNNKQCLDLQTAEKIQSKIVQGMPVYLNRASHDHRNLAMCVGEIVMPKLFELIDDYRRRRQTSMAAAATTELVGANGSCNRVVPENSREKFSLDFNVKWDDDAIELRKLFYLEVDQIFDGAGNSDGGGGSSSHNKDEPQIEARKLIDNAASPRNAVPMEADEEKKDAADDSDDEVDALDKDDASRVPIYLNDCISGLSENANPRYVRLCLIKAGELIDQLSATDECGGNKEKGGNLLLTDSGNSSLSWSSLEMRRKPLALSPAPQPAANDAIRDIGLELAQLLLYLDNQYDIERFELYRMKALSSLCIAAPDLVVKYLLDEFNGTNRNTRHQLDILQALVASARHLSGITTAAELAQPPNIGATNPPTPTAKKVIDSLAAPPYRPVGADDRRKGAKCHGRINHFVKYVSLYFYGIVEQLKADLSQPGVIVSAARSLTSRQTKLDTQRETMIRRVIGGLTSSERQLESNLKGSLLEDDERLRRQLKSSSQRRQQQQQQHPIALDGWTGHQGGLPGSSRAAEEKDYASPSEAPASRLDDSYLLSRIFFSIALLIECVDQQPITCKLSNDLLNVLAAYRRHPDSGVRRSLVACLVAVRDCTPGAYFQEFLHDKMLLLFGQWLSAEAQLIQLDQEIRVAR